MQVDQPRLEDEEDEEDGEPEQSEYESCMTDEEEEEGYLYKETDGKRYKKRNKLDDESDEDQEVFYTTRDPFSYTENVVYYHKKLDAQGAAITAPPGIEDSEYDILTDFNNVFPFGYPTEQYLCWIKNDVQKAFQKLKEEKKQALAAMKRELFEGNNNASQT